MAGSSAPPPALDDPAAQWQPFAFTVRREGSAADGADHGAGLEPDREADGRSDLESDLVEALRVRGVVGAVADGATAALPRWILVRIAVDDDGRVVTAAGGRPPRPSVQVEELVAALARQLGATAVVDEENALGPDGRPVAGEDVDLSADVAGHLRFVHAWPGTDLLGALALASSMKQPVTAYRHESWVVAVVEDHADVVLEQPPAWDLGFPFVTMSRTGEVRSVTYAAGRGRKALALELGWAPPMEPVLPDPDRDGPAVRGLAEWLSTAPLDPGDLPAHPDLDDELTEALVAAARSADGRDFLVTVGALLGVPPLVAELAERAPGAAPPAYTPERVEPSRASALVGAAFRAELTREPTGSDPFSRLRRLVRRRPGWHLAFGLLELALAALSWLSLLAGWGDVPALLRTTAAALLTLDGLGNALLAAHRLRKRRRRPGHG